MNPVDEAPLNILQKYILREWCWTFFAVIAVLLVIMLGISLGELLNDIADGRLPSGLLGQLILLELPHVLGTIIPLAVFIAIVWGLGRLYRDQEMAVMRASGFSWRMMLRPLLYLVLPVSAVALFIGLFVAPSAAEDSEERLREAFRTAEVWGLQTGRFHVLQDGDLVLYVEAVEKDGRTLNNIFMQHRQNDREQVWVAQKGYYWLNTEDGARYLTLENGQITEGGEKALDFGIVRFSRNDLRLPMPEEKSTAPSLESQPSNDLLVPDNPQESAELQWRLSPAIAVMVLGLLAIPLSHSAPREGRGGRVLMGILAYSIYANGLYMSRHWIADGSLLPAIGMNAVHFAFLAVAIIWLRRQHRGAGNR